MSTFGTPESVYEDNARKNAFDKKHKAKKKALEKAKKNKYYVGINGESGKREAFGSKETPTKESHPQYGHVRSGFKTKKQAENEKHYY